MKQISNSLELKKQIMDLKYRAFENEQQIAHELKGLSYQLHPSSLLRRWFNDAKSDSTLKGGLIKAGKDAALNFVVSSVLGRKGKLTGVLALMMAKGIISIARRKKSREELPDPSALRKVS